MPYSDPERQRKAMREIRRRSAAKKRAAKRAQITANNGPPVPANLPPLPADPAQALADWSRDRLKIPAGHPRAGQPMELPPFGVEFLRDALASDCREALLSVARKNAKSAIVAVYILGALVGPLRQRGYRAGVCSVTKEKAAELWKQCEAIAEASGLPLTRNAPTGEALRFTKVPRAIESETGSVDVLSADRSAGHASGFDVAIVDELGLLRERDRELVNGMRSAVSARDGRFLALSILGDAPFTRELLERQAEAGVAVHHYTAPEGCALDDPKAWRAANPGLGTVKAEAYMQHTARRALAVKADQSSFRAFDLNQPQSPGREMICDVADWRRCVVPADDLPPRDGQCVIGFDLGGSSSMTAAVALWPRNGRMESWGAFPAVPSLRQRGESDAVGGLYERMAERGEVMTFDGRVTPVGAFLQAVAASLAGEHILAAGADRYRAAEARQALESAGVRWPVQWRGTGAHARADGSHDVRAFQRLVLAGRLRTAESLLMESAIAESSVRRDEAGNPALSKARERSRIDALQAGVIAAGLAELRGAAKPAMRYRVV